MQKRKLTEQMNKEQQNIDYMTFMELWIDHINELPDKKFNNIMGSINDIVNSMEKLILSLQENEDKERKKND